MLHSPSDIPSPVRLSYTVRSWKNNWNHILDWLTECRGSKGIVIDETVTQIGGDVGSERGCA